jgi:membrane protease YdiL (CAAX protease family)
MKTDYQLTKPNVWKMGLFLLACIAIYIFVEIVGVLLTEWISVSPVKVLVRELMIRTPLTILLLHMFAQKVVKAYNPRAMYGGITFKGFLKWAAIGFVLPASIYLFYDVFQLMAPVEHTVLLSPANKIAIVVKCVTISVAAGLNEEILFRGHLYHILKTRCSAAMAVFFSAFIFGLVHILMLPKFTLPDALIVIAGGIINGCMLSLIYRYTRVIWYSVIVHAIWDIFFIGKITLITDHQSIANQAIFALKITNPKILFTGGSFGLEASLPSLLAITLLTGMLYLLLGRKRNVAS